MSIIKKKMKRDYSIYNDLNTTLGDRAFLTGSQAYGIPREDSDIDIVMLVTHEVLKILVENSDQKMPGYSADSQVIRFGKLNIIAFLERDKFEAWRETNEQLIKNKPITRDNAVNALSKALGK